MNYCKDCKHFQPTTYTACGAFCLAERGEFHEDDPVYGVEGTWSGKITPCSIARGKDSICGPNAALFVAVDAPKPNPRRHWSPLRIWRQMAAYREWQDQLAICETAGPEYQHLADEAEQRYKELCK